MLRFRLSPVPALPCPSRVRLKINDFAFPSTSRRKCSYLACGLSNQVRFSSLSIFFSLERKFPALREFVGSGKPLWGTCAGLIFLANKATGQKTSGQDLVGAD